MQTKNMNNQGINPDYISEPGQIQRFRSRSQHTRDLIEKTSFERGILDQMYMGILKDLVDKGMFTLRYEETTEGSVLFEVTLDIRVPLDYGTPKWESLKRQNGF